MPNSFNSNCGVQHPLPMQYLGSKTRISNWILNTIADKFSNTELVIDIMAGSGAVSHAASLAGYLIAANDIQPYSYYVLKSAFSESRSSIPALIEFLESEEFTCLVTADARSCYEALAKDEKKYLAGIDTVEGRKKYAAFASDNIGDPSNCTRKYDLFAAYYLNTYFGVDQCLEIDAVREYADAVGDSGKIHLIASLVASMSQLASTTTHLAQYLKMNSDKSIINIAEKRSLSIRKAVIERLNALLSYPFDETRIITNESYETAIPKLIIPGKNTVVYADPPYFKEHYSRYYHILDTLVLYDYPELTWNPRINDVTVGRYRKQRISSQFGKRAKAADAFRLLFSTCYQCDCDIALSYADTSLLKIDEITSIAASEGYVSELETTPLRHSGQGNRNHMVNEYLLILKREV